ncbi:MAG TPA: NUDIX hydrolase [Longimicrobiales bacterium]|jgi:ADP-ribose pyrophosphatase|nr:NUDIX hydrolase [Longimicrobiales bacterium]
MSDRDHGPRPAREGEPGTLASRVIHDGRIVHLSVDTVRFPDGSTGELEMVHHAGAAAVLPVVGDPGAADPEVLLIRQYRYAAGGELYEVPAGMPNAPGESWEEVAARELEEETGWRGRRFRYLTRIYTTPGFTDEVIRLYLATDLEKGTSRLDRDEFLEVVRVPFSQAVEWVREGRVQDGKSAVTILWTACFGPWSEPAEERAGSGA